LFIIIVIVIFRRVIYYYAVGGGGKDERWRRVYRWKRWKHIIYDNINRSEPAAENEHILYTRLPGRYNVPTLILAKKKKKKKISYFMFFILERFSTTMYSRCTRVNIECLFKAPEVGQYYAYVYYIIYTI